MKEARLKSKVPKEEFIDLDKPKNKTTKNVEGDRKPYGSSESNLEDLFGERRQPKENANEIRQSEETANDILRGEPVDVKLKR